jgi:hypothetical protein
VVYVQNRPSDQPGMLETAVDLQFRPAPVFFIFRCFIASSSLFGFPFLLFCFDFAFGLYIWCQLDISTNTKRHTFFGACMKCKRSSPTLDYIKRKPNVLKPYSSWIDQTHGSKFPIITVRTIKHMIVPVIL